MIELITTHSFCYNLVVTLIKYLVIEKFSSVSFNAMKLSSEMASLRQFFSVSTTVTTATTFFCCLQNLAFILKFILQHTLLGKNTCFCIHTQN